MSRIEVLLRDALREVGDEIGGHDVPPLRLPARAPSLDGLASRADVSVLPSRPRRRRGRRLAPLAAAASVLAVAIGIGLVAGLPPGGHVARHTCGQRCAGSPGAVPRYYIAVTGTTPNAASSQYVAAIYATFTGRQIGTIAPVGQGQTVVNVSAAADDRTFALAAEAASANLPAVTFDLVHFVPARGSGTGPRTLGAALVSGIQVPAGATFDGFALSPRGDKLAVAFQPNHNAPGLSAEIRVLNLRTMSTRTWTSSSGGAVSGDTADPWSLSWAGDDSTLAFNWLQARGRGFVLAPASGLRLLDTGGPGGDIVRASRLAVRYFDRQSNRATTAGYLSDVALLTPDGRTAVAATTAFRGPDGGFAQFSAASGRLRRILDWKPMGKFGGGGPMDVMWVSPSGGTLVVYAPPGHSNQFGVLHGNHLRVIPRPANIYSQAAAW